MKIPANVYHLPRFKKIAHESGVSQGIQKVIQLPVINKGKPNDQ